MRVLVIGGGISPERDVSLRSAKSVENALTQAGHQTTFYDWDGSEQWLTEQATGFDVVFPVLHGEGGEDGQIQAILERIGCAYVGTDSVHSAQCMDKHQTRQILGQAGLPIAEGGDVDFEAYQSHPLFNKPHVLKPANGGSSIDTFIFADNLDGRDLSQIKTAFGKHQTMLLEAFIAGQEITVPVLDGKELPVIEIIPPPDGSFDFENKYNGATQELCPPEHVDEAIQEDAVELAQKCHRAMGCRHLSRTDMIVQEDGTLVILEINTMPGMTDQSLFPKAAQVVGLSMSQLVDYLVNLAGGNNEKLS